MVQWSQDCCGVPLVPDFLQNVNLQSKTSWQWPTCSPPGDNESSMVSMTTKMMSMTRKMMSMTRKMMLTWTKMMSMWAKLMLTWAKLDDHGQHLLLQLSGPAPLPGEVDQLGRQQVKLSQFSTMSTMWTVSTISTSETVSNLFPVFSSVVQFIDFFVPFFHHYQLILITSENNHRTEGVDFWIHPQGLINDERMYPRY